MQISTFVPHFYANSALLDVFCKSKVKKKV